MTVSGQFNSMVVQLFVELVLAGFIGAGLLEKGISMLQERPYSGRRALAYLLIIYGLRLLSGLILVPGGWNQVAH
jgi:hypothetical protein